MAEEQNSLHFLGATMSLRWKLCTRSGDLQTLIPRHEKAAEAPRLQGLQVSFPLGTTVEQRSFEAWVRRAQEKPHTGTVKP